MSEAVGVDVLGDACPIAIILDGLLDTAWRERSTALRLEQVAVLGVCLHGLGLGDPVDGHFVILTTNDGGRNWKGLPVEGMPPALPGEGAFAASGTCLVAQGDGNAWFGTGGAKGSRVFRSND